MYAVRGFGARDTELQAILLSLSEVHYRTHEDVQGIFTHTDFRSEAMRGEYYTARYLRHRVPLLFRLALCKWQPPRRRRVDLTLKPSPPTSLPDGCSGNSESQCSDRGEEGVAQGRDTSRSSSGRNNNSAATRSPVSSEEGFPHWAPPSGNTSAAPQSLTNVSLSGTSDGSASLRGVNGGTPAPIKSLSAAANRLSREQQKHLAILAVQILCGDRARVREGSVEASTASCGPVWDVHTVRAFYKDHRRLVRWTCRVLQEASEWMETVVRRAVEDQVLTQPTTASLNNTTTTVASTAAPLYSSSRHLTSPALASSGGVSSSSNSLPVPPLRATPGAEATNGNCRSSVPFASTEELEEALELHCRRIRHALAVLESLLVSLAMVQPFIYRSQPSRSNIPPWLRRDTSSEENGSSSDTASASDTTGDEEAEDTATDTEEEEDDEENAERRRFCAHRRRRQNKRHDHRSDAAHRRTRKFSVDTGSSFTTESDREDEGVEEDNQNGGAVAAEEEEPPLTLLVRHCLHAFTQTFLSITAVQQQLQEYSHENRHTVTTATGTSTIASITTAAVNRSFAVVMATASGHDANCNELLTPGYLNSGDKGTSSIVSGASPCESEVSQPLVTARGTPAAYACRICQRFHAVEEVLLVATNDNLEVLKKAAIAFAAHHSAIAEESIRVIDAEGPVFTSQATMLFAHVLTPALLAAHPPGSRGGMALEWVLNYVFGGCSGADVRLHQREQELQHTNAATDTNSSFDCFSLANSSFSSANPQSGDASDQDGRSSDGGWRGMSTAADRGNSAASSVLRRSSRHDGTDDGGGSSQLPLDSMDGEEKDADSDGQAPGKEEDAGPELGAQATNMRVEYVLAACFTRCHPLMTVIGCVAEDNQYNCGHTVAQAVLQYAFTLSQTSARLLRTPLLTNTWSTPFTEAMMRGLSELAAHAHQNVAVAPPAPTTGVGYISSYGGGGGTGDAGTGGGGAGTNGGLAWSFASCPVPGGTANSSFAGPDRGLAPLLAAQLRVPTAVVSSAIRQAQRPRPYSFIPPPAAVVTGATDADNAEVAQVRTMRRCLALHWAKCVLLSARTLTRSGTYDVAVPFEHYVHIRGARLQRRQRMLDYRDRMRLHFQETGDHTRVRRLDEAFERWEEDERRMTAKDLELARDEEGSFATAGAFTQNHTPSTPGLADSAEGYGVVSLQPGQVGAVAHGTAISGGDPLTHFDSHHNPHTISGATASFAAAQPHLGGVGGLFVPLTALHDEGNAGGPLPMDAGSNPGSIGADPLGRSFDHTVEKESYRRAFVDSFCFGKSDFELLSAALLGKSHGPVMVPVHMIVYTSLFTILDAMSDVLLCAQPRLSSVVANELLTLLYEAQLSMLEPLHEDAMAVMERSGSTSSTEDDEVESSTTYSAGTSENSLSPAMSPARAHPPDFSQSISSDSFVSPASSMKGSSTPTVSSLPTSYKSHPLLSDDGGHPISPVLSTKQKEDNGDGTRICMSSALTQGSGERRRRKRPAKANTNAAAINRDSHILLFNEYTLLLEAGLRTPLVVRRWREDVRHDPDHAARGYLSLLGHLQFRQSQWAEPSQEEYLVSRSTLRLMLGVTARDARGNIHSNMLHVDDLDVMGSRKEEVAPRIGVTSSKDSLSAPKYADEWDPTMVESTDAHAAASQFTTVSMDDLTFSHAAHSADSIDHLTPTTEDAVGLRSVGSPVGPWAWRQVTGSPATPFRSHTADDVTLPLTSGGHGALTSWKPPLGVTASAGAAGLGGAVWSGTGFGAYVVPSVHSPVAAQASRTVGGGSAGVSLGMMPMGSPNGMIGPRTSSFECVSLLGTRLEAGTSGPLLLHRPVPVSYRTHVDGDMVSDSGSDEADADESDAEREQSITEGVVGTGGPLAYSAPDHATPSVLHTASASFGTDEFRVQHRAPPPPPLLPASDPHMVHLDSGSEGPENMSFMSAITYPGDDTEGGEGRRAGVSRRSTPPGSVSGHSSAQCSPLLAHAGGHHSHGAHHHHYHPHDDHHRHTHHPHRIPPTAASPGPHASASSQHSPHHSSEQGAARVSPLSVDHHDSQTHQHPHHYHHTHHGHAGRAAHAPWRHMPTRVTLAGAPGELKTMVSRMPPTWALTEEPVPNVADRTAPEVNVQYAAVRTVTTPPPADADDGDEAVAREEEGEEEEEEDSREDSENAPSPDTPEEVHAQATSPASTSSRESGEEESPVEEGEGVSLGVSDASSPSDPEEGTVRDAAGHKTNGVAAQAAPMTRLLVQGESRPRATVAATRLVATMENAAEHSDPPRSDDADEHSAYDDGKEEEDGVNSDMSSAGDGEELAGTLVRRTAVNFARARAEAEEKAVGEEGGEERFPPELSFSEDPADVGVPLASFGAAQPTERNTADDTATAASAFVAAHRECCINVNPALPAPPELQMTSPPPTPPASISFSMAIPVSGMQRAVRVVTVSTPLNAAGVLSPPSRGGAVALFSPLRISGDSSTGSTPLTVGNSPAKDAALTRAIHRVLQHRRGTPSGLPPTGQGGSAPPSLSCSASYGHSTGSGSPSAMLMLAPEEGEEGEMEVGSAAPLQLSPSRTELTGDAVTGRLASPDFWQQTLSRLKETTSTHRTESDTTSPTSFRSVDPQVDGDGVDSLAPFLPPSQPTGETDFAGEGGRRVHGTCAGSDTPVVPFVKLSLGRHSRPTSPQLQPLTTGIRRGSSGSVGGKATPLPAHQQAKVEASHIAFTVTPTGPSALLAGAVRSKATTTTNVASLTRMNGAALISPRLASSLPHDISWYTASGCGITVAAAARTRTGTTTRSVMEGQPVLPMTPISEELMPSVAVLPRFSRTEGEEEEGQSTGAAVRALLGVRIGQGGHNARTWPEVRGADESEIESPVMTLMSSAAARDRGTASSPTFSIPSMGFAASPSSSTVTTKPTIGIVSPSLVASQATTTVVATGERTSIMGGLRHAGSPLSPCAGTAAAGAARRTVRFSTDEALPSSSSDGSQSSGEAAIRKPSESTPPCAMLNGGGIEEAARRRRRVQGRAIPPRPSGNGGGAQRPRSSPTAVTGGYQSSNDSDVST